MKSRFWWGRGGSACASKSLLPTTCHRQQASTSTRGGTKLREAGATSTRQRTRLTNPTRTSGLRRSVRRRAVACASSVHSTAGAQPADRNPSHGVAWQEGCWSRYACSNLRLGFPQPHSSHSLIHSLMADSSYLFLSTPEAKILHIVNILLSIERCDSTFKGHGWHCWYSRVVFLIHGPVALFSAFSLYKLFRPA